MIRRVNRERTSDIVPDAHVLEFQDSISGTQCVDGDVINADAYVLEYILNDDSRSMREFIRIYIESDEVTAAFEVVKPELYFYLWQLAIEHDAYEICLLFLSLSGTIMPVINPDTFKYLTVIYRNFWSSDSNRMAENIFIPIILYNDVEMLLMNAMNFLNQYNRDLEISSLTDEEIDITYSGVIDTNIEMTRIENDIANGEIHGDVGGLELYENNQLPGDRYIRLNSNRLIEYLEEFERVIDKTYGYPYRSIFDLACAVGDINVFKKLKDQGVSFNPDRAPELLSPRYYGFIEQLGEVYNFDSSKLPLGGIFSTLSEFLIVD